MSDTLKKVAQAMEKDPAVAAAIGMTVDLAAQRAKLAVTTMASSDKPAEALSDAELALELGLSAERIAMIKDSGLTFGEIAEVTGELLGVALRGALKGATGI